MDRGQEPWVGRKWQVLSSLSFYSTDGEATPPYPSTLEEQLRQLLKVLNTALLANVYVPMWHLCVDPFVWRAEVNVRCLPRLPLR